MKTLKQKMKYSLNNECCKSDEVEYFKRSARNIGGEQNP